MSEQINEQISALLDGELSEAELSPLLNQIAAQPGLMQQAQCVQQSRLCLQGEKPASSFNDSLQFTARIQEAIRNEPDLPVYDFTQQRVLTDQIDDTPLSSALGSTPGVATSSLSSQSSDTKFSATDINVSRPAANEPGKWRPLFGAGVAAAVAMVAVSAWQSQPSVEQDVTSLSAQSEAAPDFKVKSAAPLIQNKAALLQAKQNLEQTISQGAANPVQVNNDSSYTVPELSTLSTVDQSFARMDDLRQVKYSSYVLQNQVAPRNTSNDLYRDAQQFRVRQLPQFFIDPRTGQVIMSITPVEANE